MKLPFRLILRTFGKDTPSVVEQLKTRGVEILRSGTFTAKSLSIGERVLESTQEIFQEFLKEGHLAIQDDWKHWNQNGEKSEFGKLFLVDPTKKVISLFFDDNATGEPFDIVQARDALTAEPLPENGFGKTVFRVNPIEALLNDHYFTDLTFRALRD
jgi:hypothetical protein